MVKFRVCVQSVLSHVKVEGEKVTKLGSLELNVNETWQGDPGQIIGSSNAIVVVVELPSCKVNVAGVDEILGTALAGATS